MADGLGAMKSNVPLKSESTSRDDVDLVRRGRHGSPAERGPLVERLKCVPRILAALNARIGGELSEHDLADLSQDTLIVIWGKLDDFEGRAKLETWVYRICYLELMNRLRRLRRAARRNPGPGALADAAAADAPLSYALELEPVIRALDALTPQESDVLRLKHSEGRTFREIGQALQIPTNTAKTVYYRGIERLSRLLEQGGTAP